MNNIEIAYIVGGIEKIRDYIDQIIEDEGIIKRYDVIPRFNKLINKINDCNKTDDEN